MQKLAPLTVGWKEWISLPQLGLPAVKAKMDTGARTSSIHAEEMHSFTRDGIAYLRFVVHPLQRKKLAVCCEAPLVDERSVKSSSGHREQRPVIRTSLSLGGREWVIDLNLTDRGSMGSRMLIGREAMQGYLIIDPHSMFRFGPRLKADLAAVYGMEASAKGSAV
jgi:ribosomal protein S6--L-glutamate ligase